MISVIPSETKSFAAFENILKISRTGVFRLLEGGFLLDVT
jgi:hypothetical protein